MALKRSRNTMCVNVTNVYTDSQKGNSKDIVSFESYEIELINEAYSNSTIRLYSIETQQSISSL